MQILSDTHSDTSSLKPLPGSYEWWYFDAISTDGEYSIVVIFYEGNPFSRRYTEAMAEGTNPLARKFPALSLSVYKNKTPIFYSFEEVLPGEASFSSENPEGYVKGNRFWRDIKDDLLIYNLAINQNMPNGDHLAGELRFTSTLHNFFPEDEKPETEEQKHRWNLVQPRAEVVGELKVSGYYEKNIVFTGAGYHDHNTGTEPMAKSFEEWYWGRIHFLGNTLVYYLMNENGLMNSRGWIFNTAGKTRIIEKGIEPHDKGRNKFGLLAARKIEKREGELRFLIQKTDVLDDGPFYQRFLNRLILHMDGEIYQGSGISEYICPSRIQNKLFRPLVNMRIQYPGKEHWVQKNPRLYRWTW